MGSGGCCCRCPCCSPPAARSPPEPRRRLLPTLTPLELAACRSDGELLLLAALLGGPCGFRVCSRAASLQTRGPCNASTWSGRRRRRPAGSSEVRAAAAAACRQQRRRAGCRRPAHLRFFAELMRGPPGLAPELPAACDIVARQRAGRDTLAVQSASPSCRDRMKGLWPRPECLPPWRRLVRHTQAAKGSRRASTPLACT